MNTRYIGIYNYSKDEIPITKMVSFGDDKEIVRQEIEFHSQINQIPHSDYHISEYRCESWDIEHPSIPEKKNEETL